MSQMGGSDDEGLVYQKLKPSWKLPTPPDGFTTPVAFHFPDGDVRLDWTRDPECDFASEYLEFTLEWPFIDGFVPTDNEWEIVGFMPLH